MKFDLRSRAVAEFLGTAFLLAAVVGSGIMGERLAGGNVAMGPLANIAFHGSDPGGPGSSACSHLRCAFQSCGYAGDEV